MGEPVPRDTDLITLPSGPSQHPLLLGPAEMRQVLSLEAAFESQVMAFMSLAGGEAVAPDRLTFPATEAAALAIVNASRLAADAGIVASLTSVIEGNPAGGLPLVVGVVAVVDPQTGLLAALMDGATLVALRTAAASAVAAAALAREPVHRLAVVGSGVQGRAHAMAIAKALPIREVRVYSRRVEGRESAAADLAAALDLDVAAAGSVEEAVRGADVVALCTHSSTPVLLGDWVEAGAVVISVGSNTPERREVDDILLERAGRIVVDQLEGGVRQGGPIIRALELGAVRRDQLVELGRVLVGEDPGRVDPDQVLFYNSVGVGVQDAAAAWVALHRARELGLGRPLDLS